MALTTRPTTAPIGGDARPAAPPAAGEERPRALHPSEVNWAALRRVYPESDGKPMADNTKQYRYIQTIAGGLQAMFRHDPDVFVAGDFLWYPVEGHPEICQAPDAMVVFGRPKGDRGSYAQFIEGGIAPQVVFEVLSPKNTAPEMARKRDFYERYGVEEYYEYDPQRGRMQGWQRDEAGALAPIAEMQGRVSPRLGIRFELQPDGELRLIMPDGRPFLTVEELADERDATAQRLEQEQQRAERLAAQLRALGIEPDGES